MRYNAYIVRSSDDVAVSLIGKEMTGDKADKRSETALDRINKDSFWSQSEKVGSPKDLKYTADVAAKK